MATPTQPIKNFSVFVNNAKMATATASDYTWEGNREIQVGDGIVVGISQGVQLTELTSDNVVPFGGNPTLAVLENAHKTGSPIDISLGVVNGRIHKVQMWVTKFQYKGENKQGVQTAHVTFAGGPPELVG